MHSLRFTSLKRERKYGYSLIWSSECTLALITLALILPHARVTSLCLAPLFGVRWLATVFTSPGFAGTAIVRAPEKQL